jgi:hypothetical protein
LPLNGSTVLRVSAIIRLLTTWHASFGSNFLSRPWECWLAAFNRLQPMNFCEHSIMLSSVASQMKVDPSDVRW